MKKTRVELVWDLFLASLVLFALLGARFAYPDQYYSYPGPGVSAYPTTAQLPAYSSDGTVAIVTSTYTLYSFEVATLTWVPITAGSGPFLPLSGGTITGPLKYGNCHLEPAESNIGNSGSSQTLNLSSFNVFTTTLNAATPAFTFSNPQAGCPYAFIFTQDVTGSRIPSFSGVTVLWSGGAHTFSTTANAVDKFSCVYNGNITSLMCDLGLAYQ